MPIESDIGVKVASVSVSVFDVVGAVGVVVVAVAVGVVDVIVAVAFDVIGALGVVVAVAVGAVAKDDRLSSVGLFSSLLD